MSLEFVECALSKRSTHLPRKFCKLSNIQSINIVSSSYVRCLRLRSDFTCCLPALLAWAGEEVRGARASSLCSLFTLHLTLYITFFIYLFLYFFFWLLSRLIFVLLRVGSFWVSAFFFLIVVDFKIHIGETFNV